MVRRIAVVSLPLIALLLYVGSSLRDPRSLRPLLSLRHPEVRWVDTTTLAEWIESSDPPLLLDVREEVEFRVSHLPGATRVSPSADRLELPEGRRVVVYCSVGARSGELAERLGGAEVYNLSGGVFAWANEGRALLNGQGATTLVHPYDETWGRFVHPSLRAPVP